MSAQLTHAQRTAVEGRGVVFVSAGAGTGKTTVLVERVAQAIESGLDPERVLVVTFTERAAQQLVSRIRARLAETDEALARLADRAEIATIHGFCARLLRQHAFAAGIDPDFRVLDEASSRILADEAFERALREAVDEEPDEALELLVAYGGPRLRAMLSTVAERLRSAGLPLTPELPPAADLPAAIERARAACGVVEARYATDERPRAAGNRRRAELLARRLASPPDAEFLIDLDDCRLRHAPPELAEYVEALQALQQAALDAVAERQHRRLTALLARYDRAYGALKDAEGALDFADLELRARDLLHDPPGGGVNRVRAAAHERYRHVLVDEFQDTNRLQCELIDLVAADDAERFFVGDEFQSIYRFRHADVDVFMQRRATAPSQVALQDNYRSRPEVLSVVNDLFGRVFGEGYRTLDAGRRFEGAAFEHAVELCVVDRAGTAAEEWRAAEAALVAERVRAIVDAGEHTAGDVVVLLRSATDADVYEQALGAAGLETHRAIGRGYYGRQQVLDLCSYLRLLRNRYDDRALLTVLASPLVGLSNDGLMRVRRAARAGLFHGIERTLPDGLSDADTGLLRAFRQRYDRLVRDMGEIGLEDLCERIVQQHDYDLACLAQRDGRRRYANVRKLLRLAREYEALRGPDLPGFLAFVDAQAGAGRESEAPTADEEGGDAVRLMTIHSAKGLEFPVVVVADCGRASPSAAEDIIALPDGRFGFRVPDPQGALHRPAAYNAVLEAEQSADELEQRRIIYVAMTRAVDRLIISGALAGGRDTSPLAWMLDGLKVDVAALTPGLAHVHALESGVQLLVHLRRPGDEPAAPVAAPATEPREQLTLFGDDEAPAQPAEPAPIATLPLLPPLPTAPAHVPRRLSFSAIALHDRCPYRYYAERVLGLAPVDRRPALVGGAPRLAAYEIGDAVHVLLETGDVASLEGRYAAPIGDDDRARIDSLLAAWESSELAARVAALQAPRRELPFAFVEDGAVLRGRIDVCGREADGTMLVVDYKTNVLGESDPAVVVDEGYAIQRTVYALAALRSGVPAVEVVFAFLDRPGACVVARFTQDDEPQLTASLREAIERLRTSSFEPRPSDWTCADCGALDRVCAGPRLVDRLEP
jgi:ATP-dependent exoDNAse (exonuclease V) beta subunit